MAGQFVYPNMEYEHYGGVLHCGGSYHTASAVEDTPKISVCAVAGGGLPAYLSGVREHSLQPV